MYSVDIIFRDSSEYHNSKVDSATFSKYERLFIISLENKEWLGFPTDTISQISVQEVKEE